MKKFFKFLVVAALPAITFVACDNGNEVDDNDKDLALTPVVEQYVNKTVIPTYKNLADATIELVEALEALRASVTEANINAATSAWKETRVHWEQSEAFLFGAVADFGIDPHIDTWPLDENRLASTVSNQGFLDGMEEEGAAWVDANLGSSLIGFHGIEYVLFANGEAKSLTEITSIKDSELIYAIAVAEDLRNRCIQLEVSWAGEDKVTADKKELMEELELPVTASNSSLSYGENMLKAGQLGSTYPSVTAAAAQIMDGAITIADEVGNIKIGTAANEGDKENYNADHIESPYSHNSLKDFHDNIVSIENAYLGGPAASRDASKSLSNYIKSVDASVDQTVKDAITASYAAIAAIQPPFKTNYNTQKADDAVRIIGTDLVEALEAANAIILEQ
ncbi:MAG: peptidase M75 [Prevotellaceae bacterium]|jgi:uncharacterized iron-regulated protein|nr:peptidase M75 [Prevotellaceae bacterium]